MITVHKLTLRWSNAWLLVNGTHAVLIDTGYPGETERIRTLCRSRNVDPNRLTLIVHTHVHVDHFGCTAELAKAADCPITFHPADQHLADQKTPLQLTPATFSGRLLAPLFNNKTFRNHPCDFPALAGLRLDSFGIPATIHQTPGHTAGSISVVLDDGRAIIGDLLMGGVCWRMVVVSQTTAALLCRGSATDSDQSGSPASHHFRPAVSRTWRTTAAF